MACSECQKRRSTLGSPLRRSESTRTAPPITASVRYEVVDPEGRVILTTDSLVSASAKARSVGGVTRPVK